MDFPLPPMGEGLFEVELLQWLVKPGESIARGQSLMEVMSDKATMEVPSPFAGTVTQTVGVAGTKIKIGEVVLRYEQTNGVPNAAPKPVAIAVVEAPVSLKVDVEADAPNLPASIAAPSVRHLARKLGIDLKHLQGTGPAGRILLEDVSQQMARKAEASPNKPAKSPLPPMDFGKPGTRVKLVGLRRKIAEHMVASTTTIPHYSYIDECDLTDLVRLRGQLKETFAKLGVKLTYLPFFVKAVARALKEIPIINCTYDAATEEMVMHERYNIGIAVAAPNGLVVPVIQDADKKDIAAIATEIERLSSDVRAGRPKVNDMKGGTFTITSIGGIGGLISTPIINTPEVGIMGIGKVVKRPVFDDHGAIKPAEIVYLSFSFDHRIVDGAVGATFGNSVIRHLQNPASLLLPERYGS